MLRNIFLLLLLVLTTPTLANERLPLSDTVTAELANRSEKEIAAYEQMRRLFKQHHLDKYSVTKHIRFQQFIIPHSHPVLTLNTRTIEDDNKALSTFLHEQIHWMEEANLDKVKAAIADFRKLLKDVPSNKKQGGARSEYSTYLHLIVCMLEHDTLESLIGAAAARETTLTHRHYKWIYKQVLENPALLRSILKKHGLSFPSPKS